MEQIELSVSANMQEGLLQAHTNACVVKSGASNAHRLRPVPTALHDADSGAHTSLRLFFDGQAKHWYLKELVNSMPHARSCLCMGLLMVYTQISGNSWVSKFHAGCCDANLNFVTSAQQAKMKESGEWTGEECFTEADLPSLEVLYTNSIYW